MAPVGIEAYQISDAQYELAHAAPDTCVAAIPAMDTEATEIGAPIRANIATATTRLAFAVPIEGSPPELYVIEVPPTESSLVAVAVMEKVTLLAAAGGL